MPSLAETLEPRWRTLWKRLGARGDPKPVFDQLVWLYTDPARRYHTLDHIAHCLAELDDAMCEVALRPKDADLVEVALWFHDAVYVPGLRYNEQLSGALAWRILFEASLPPNTCGDISELIMATAAHQPSQCPEYATLIDIDLAILGRPEAEFDAYEEGIRFEYQRVPDDQFRAGRIAILEGFLARERIYRTEHFRTKYEMRASANLERSIAQLRAA